MKVWLFRNDMFTKTYRRYLWIWKQTTAKTTQWYKIHENVPYKIGVKQGDNVAPVLFIYLMIAVVKSLSSKWDFNKLEYNWFPESANGNKRGRLNGQSPKAIGSKFDLFYFLYVDDGAMLAIWKNREDIIFFKICLW